MILHTGERWAQEAGEEEPMGWCRVCGTWVVPAWDIDEEKRYAEWCPMCGGDLITEELPPEEEPDDCPVG